MSSKIKNIAVNTRLLLPGGVEGIGRFSVEVLKRMVKNHPEVNFHFFFDRKFDEQYLFGPNVIPHVLFPQARHPFLFIWFFEYSVAAKLKKVKADVFFSPDGYLSLRSKVPQVPVFHDLAFEHFPQDVKKIEAWHYRKYFPKYAEKAAKILCVSQFTKADIVGKYGVSEDKIAVTYNACGPNFHPIAEAEKLKIRAKYTANKPYFISVGAIQPRKNLARLISAFGKFKEQTGSDWQLVLVGRKAWNFEEVIHTYRESRFKDDIIFTGFVSDEELNALYAASEALCYVPYFEGFGLPILEAMHSETAVICSGVTSMPEVAGDAALLIDPYQPDEIVAAMKRLHETPELRTELIQKGRQQRTVFNWDRTAEEIWNHFQKL